MFTFNGKTYGIDLIPNCDADMWTVTEAGKLLGFIKGRKTVKNIVNAANENALERFNSLLDKAINEAKQPEALIGLSGKFLHRETKQEFAFLPFNLENETSTWDVSEETGAYNRLVYIPWLQKMNPTHLVLVRNDDGWGFITPSNTRFARVCDDKAFMLCGDSEDEFEVWPIRQLVKK